MEKIVYRGWPNCYRLSNGLVELIVTTDVGPRISHFGFVGEANEFKEYEGMMGQTGGEEWYIYGGHRLWHAPEAQPRTYFPDNSPVKIVDDEKGVRLVQTVETTTGIEKEIDLALVDGEPGVRVTHRLRNLNMWTIELAPWALSVMAQGGKAIVPLPPRGTHEENLLPANTLTLWAYTDMTDPRWTWGNKYVMLHQDPQIAKPQKVGCMVPDGWVGYVRGGHLFLKTFSYLPGAAYPDLGCSVEIFANDDMLEVETLGALVHLEPGGVVEHVEHWWLFRDVPTPQDDEDVDRHVLPRVQSVQ